MTKDSYPSHPLRLIVGASAGSAAAILARAFAPALAAELRQPLNIEFHQGENNESGAALLTQSAPDGYTILMTTLGVLAIRPNLHPETRAAAGSELTPVALVARCPLLLAVHPSVPAQSVDELTRYARAHPGELTFAASAIGGAPHVAAELYMSMTGVDMRLACYQSTHKLFDDLKAGRLSLTFNNIMSMLEPLAKGEFRGLAVTSAKRSAAVPALPTMDETGLAGYEITNWLGIVAPPRTAPPLVATLNSAIIAALNSDEVTRNLTACGMQAAGSSAAEFTRYIHSELERWAPIVKACAARKAEFR